MDLHLLRSNISLKNVDFDFTFDSLCDFFNHLYRYLKQFLKLPGQ